MSDIIISVTGLSELLSQATRFPKEVQEEIEAEVYDSVSRINAMQRRKAPKDQGGLVRGIGYSTRRAQNVAYYEVYSNAEQSGYMEFGTRYRVRVPSNLQGIAQAMKGKGISTKLKAKEAIYAWCKRKGIEERAWYPIFIAIMTVGIIPHPFFFQPFFDEAPKLLERIRKIVVANSSGNISVIMPGEFVRNTKTITI